MIEGRLIGFLVSCLAFAAFVTGTYFYGEHRGAIIERATWQAKEISRKDSETSAVATRNTENDADRVKFEEMKRKLIDEKSTEIKAVHAMYDGYVPGSLRVSKDRVCGKGSSSPAQANGATGIDATTSDTVALPDEIERNLRQLAREADEITATARSLQEFVKQSQ